MPGDVPNDANEIEDIQQVVVHVLIAEMILADEEDGRGSRSGRGRGPDVGRRTGPVCSDVVVENGGRRWRGRLESDGPPGNSRVDRLPSGVAVGPVHTRSIG